jgi:hypothetical protein
MRYMFLVKSAYAGPPSERLMEEMGKLAAREYAAGTVVDMGGLTPYETGASIRLKGGKLNVVDGPYAEAKEVIGGYAIFDYPTRERALESAVEFMELHAKYGDGWEGECEMRPIAPNE